MRKKQNSIQLYNPITDIPCILRHCAEQLFSQAGVTGCNRLLNDLASDSEYLSFCMEHSELSDITYTYHSDEDSLGLLYQSLCDISSRKNSGSYYTPASVAANLIKKHLPDISSSQTIFDPSCGTGIFLLQLPDYIPLAKLYGNDLNPLCITLTRINLAIKYRISTAEELDILYRNFTVWDYLKKTNFLDNRRTIHGFDIILGNPPWGATLTESEEKEYREHFLCITKQSTEVFDLFIEQSLSMLPEGGILSFVLPEALLSVKMHQPVRRLLLQSCTALSVEYLGEVFRNVYCPSIILTLKKAKADSFYKNAKVYVKDHMYTISTKRIADETCLSFALSDKEYALLEKIKLTPNCTTLKGQADFALGIVTGNNSSLVLDTPTAGAEPIIKGKDISKYHIDSYSGYLHFQPEHFQQTAPEQFYRAKEKLFYRFINSQLVFAYDNTGLLSLNSCNIVIPRIHELSVKYVMAILNSSVAQFVFEKKFTSVKVLRSHLEEIPIPVVDSKTQKQIVAMVDVLMNTVKGSQEYQTTFLTLDKVIGEIFGLNDEEYGTLSKS